MASGRNLDKYDGRSGANYLYGSQPKIDRNSTSQPNDHIEQQRNLPHINSMKNIREIDVVKANSNSRVALGVPASGNTSTKETTGRMNSNISASQKYNAMSS